MTRARTVGEKRRLKKLARDMPKLAEVPRAKQRGRARMKEIEKDVQAVVLETRARRMGKPASEAREMNRQRLSDGAGMALSLLCDPDTAEDLWRLYVALTASEARYHRSIGKSIHPKIAKIEMMQERFETRPDDQIDLRTPDQRDRDAVRRWMYWQGVIGHLAAHHQSAIFVAYRHNFDMVDTGKVTPAGRRFVEAMRLLGEVV